MIVHTNVGGAASPSENYAFTLFTSLPFELQVHVIAQLPLKNCTSLVCKKLSKMNLDIRIDRLNKREINFEAIGIEYASEAIEFLKHNQKRLFAFDFNIRTILIEDLKSVENLKNLQSISFNICGLPDSFADSLSKLPCLKNLQLNSILLNSAGVCDLFQLTQIEHLKIESERTPELKKLAQMDNLKSLSIAMQCEQSVTDEDIDLFNLNKFIDINLAFEYISSDDIIEWEKLSTLHNLHSLSFEEADVNVENFSKLTALQSLTFDFVSLDGHEDLNALKKLNHLHTLIFKQQYDLFDAEFAQASWQTLNALTQLQQITFDACEYVTPENIARLQENLPHTKIHFMPFEPAADSSNSDQEEGDL